MTSFAFIVGVALLAVATGAGAEMRQSPWNRRALWSDRCDLLRASFHTGLLHLHSQAWPEVIASSRYEVVSRDEHATFLIDEGPPG